MHWNNLPLWKRAVFAPFLLLAGLSVLLSALPLLLLGAVFTLYWWLYPERHAHEADFSGTPEEQAALAEYRRTQSQKSLWQRFSEKFHRQPGNEDEY